MCEAEGWWQRHLMAPVVNNEWHHSSMYVYVKVFPKRKAVQNVMNKCSLCSFPLLSQAVQVNARKIAKT